MSTYKDLKRYKLMAYIFLIKKRTIFIATLEDY